MHGGLAHLGERLPCTQKARGSNPLTSTWRNIMRCLCLILLAICLGCGSPATDVIQDHKEQSEFILSGIEGKKLDSVRYNGTSVDFVFEGKLITVYGYSVNNSGGVFSQRVAIK